MSLRRPRHFTAAAAVVLTLAGGFTAGAVLAQAVVPGASSAPSSTLSRADTAFLKQAAENGHAEIESSRVALQKGSHAEVKRFAQMMIDDHTKTGQELSALASAKGLQVPTEPSMVQKGKMKILEARDGASFDRHYAEAMGVEAHKDTIKLFEKAAKGADDADVKAFATKTLPALQHHLQAAQQLMTATKAADGKK